MPAGTRSNATLAASRLLREPSRSTEKKLPSCAHDDDRLRLPPASPAHNSKAGKKESTGRRLNRPRRPCATPSSNSSLGYHHNDARTAENGFYTLGGSAADRADL